MSSGKKVLNVLGIITSVFLSIALVVSLIITPVMFSTMSILNANNISKLFMSIDFEEVILSEVGDNAENEFFVEILESDMAEEVIDTYSKDISAVLLGKDRDTKFDADYVEELIEDNIDEVVNILEKTGEFEGKTKSEIKEELEENVDELAEELAKMMPSAKELKKQFVKENDEVKEIFDALEKLGALKMTMIVTIVVLSGLIFVCRLFDFRGFKWLYVDLFIASVFSALTCAGLSLGKGLVGEMIKGEETVSSVVDQLLSTVITGTIIRTVIMFVVAIGLVVAYVFVKKALAKKCATQTVEEIVEEIPALEESANTAEL